MYRQYILKEMQSFFEQKDEFTAGQILFSIISAREEKSLTKSQWLMQVSDEDFYTAIQNAKEIENEG